MKTILIIGAYSAIAEETAKIYAAQRNRLVLWGRNLERLKSVQLNLAVLGASEVFPFAMDLDDCASHGAMLEETLDKVGKIDIALVAHGVLPDQSAVEKDFNAMASSLHTNFISYASLLTVLATYFESRKSGTLAVITSVAADRGRKSNYVYGAAKAGASAFADGLRGRLSSSGVHLVNIKPGMVDSPMTAHLKKGSLFAKPSTVAEGIEKAIRQNKNTVYLPGYWRPIMWVIRSVPEFLFKKTNV